MSLTGALLIVLIAAAAVLALYVTRHLGQASAARQDGVSAASGTKAPSPPRPAGQLPILGFEALLRRTGTAGFVHQIERRSGFAREAFERDGLPLLRAVAEYVQLFPASEAHHHAQEGGLLIHLLETAAYALHFREGVELPLAAPPEERARLKHRWTYGVLVAALLHDIGKPLADLRITLYGTDPKSGAPWRAFAGPLAEAPGATHYTVGFASPSERDYDAHRRLAYSLAQAVVPQGARRWLAEDPALMRELAAYLSGEAREGAIATLVKRADAESVRQDLRQGPRTRFASARAVPLIERLMAGLRRMLAEGGHLPLNKPGAAGWVYRGELWFVSKRLADAVREYLNRHEERREGAPGMPENNERLFDTWCEYGACVVNPETNGAVWSAYVQMAGFHQRLTLLRFPLAKLYPDAQHYPADMDGRIVVLSRADAGKPGAEEPTPLRADATIHEMGMAEAAAASDTQTAETGASAATEIPAGEGARPAALTDSIEPTFAPSSSREIPFTAGVEEPAGFLDEADCAARELARDAANPTAPPLAPSAPVAPAAPRTAASLLGNADKPVSKSKQSALRFFAWIQQGIAAGTIKYNAAEARIHFVPEGMLLVSPGTFRDFAAAFGDVGAPATPSASGKDRLGNGIQNAVKRSGLVVPAAKGNYLHRYQVLRNGAQGGFLNCFLMPNPERFFNPVPPPNPLLKRFTPDGARDGTLPD